MKALSFRLLIWPKLGAARVTSDPVPPNRVRLTAAMLCASYSRRYRRNCTLTSLFRVMNRLSKSFMVEAELQNSCRITIRRNTRYTEFLLIDTRMGYIHDLGWDTI